MGQLNRFLVFLSSEATVHIRQFIGFVARSVLIHDVDVSVFGDLLGQEAHCFRRACQTVGMDVSYSWTWPE